jgi:hypothetical protein
MKSLAVGTTCLSAFAWRGDACADGSAIPNRAPTPDAGRVRLRGTHQRVHERALLVLAQLDHVSRFQSPDRGLG